MIEGSADNNPMVLLGEVHSGLLQTSTALPSSFCEQVLGLLHGERVRRFERPIAHVVSPELLTGVDCWLAAPSSAKVRGVGTVSCHASITGGHVLQASASVRVAAGGGRRLPWSHYLARPGHLELVGKIAPARLAEAFVAPKPDNGTLNLGAVSTRVVDLVQASPKLDRKPPMRAARTRLRWAAMASESGAPDRLRFGVEQGKLRTMLLTVDRARLPMVAEFCEDLALHDWLLTTLLHAIEVSRIGLDSRVRTANRLRPVVDHLLHLWMPAARIERSACELWSSLERRPGLSRQWQAGVDRIRDQIAMSTVMALGARLEEAPLARQVAT
jgi:hypothetical protein